jgi:hypothetical protein
MNVNPILPIAIDYMEWASQIRIDIPLLTFPIPEKVSDWRGWACQVVADNSLSTVPTPTSTSFPGDDGWKKWAAYFVETIYNNNI